MPFSGLTLTPAGASAMFSRPTTPSHWQRDLPPTYEEATGEPRVPGPAVRGTSSGTLEGISNTTRLWSRDSERALSRPLPASGELPKVVTKELKALFDQRQRTQLKLDKARNSLERIEWGLGSSDPLQVIAARGALFDDDESYALHAAQGKVHYYEAKQEQLLIAHVQRMTQLGRRTG